MVSRPRGALLDLEYEILGVVTELQASGDDAYGFSIARRLASADEVDRLIGHGTLYKALARLAANDLLESAWEEVGEEVDLRRPRRRLYRLTAEGSRALARRSFPAAATAPKAALA